MLLYRTPDYTVTPDYPVTLDYPIRSKRCMIQDQETLPLIFPCRMDIQIQNRQSSQSLSLPSIRLFLEKCLETLNLSDAELSVLFVSDSEIRQLNLEYRGLDRPTDVLAFSMREGEGAEINPGVLGDIVVSTEMAQRQGEEVGWGLEKEIEKLLVHGLLHLIGYDHETNPDEAARMQQKEDEVLTIAAGHIEL